MNLTVGTIWEVFHATVAFGSVIMQRPPANTLVSPGSAVTLSVSKGPQPVTVPYVVGETQTAASTAIAGADLAVGSVTQECSDAVTPGCVISQSPAAGTEGLASGNTVALVVCTGRCSDVTEETLLPGGVPLVMVWIPDGAFMMGRYPLERYSYSSEDPNHSVTLGGYWMGKYELTKRQWMAVMDWAPWTGLSYDLDSPAVCVSWDDAQSFLKAVNIYTGKRFCLPSEAQWEYACRGKTSSRFYWGDDPGYADVYPIYVAIGDYAWYDGNAGSAGQQYAHVVGQKLPNAFGLYDMSGNVWEWCQDWWHQSYTGAPTDGQAWMFSPRDYWAVVYRGGGWSDSSSLCRSAGRALSGPSYPGVPYLDLGFRVSRTP